MKLFHGTSEASAEAILREGFRDTKAHWAFEHEAGSEGGVWLADVPLDENEGARSGDLHLVVDIPEEVVSEWEVIENDHPNRIFKPPAEIVNRYLNAVRVATEDEEMEAAERRWNRLRARSDVPDIPFRSDE
jgi:hypothetical protein